MNAFPSPKEQAALVRLGEMRTRLAVTVSMLEIAQHYLDCGLPDQAARLLKQTHQAQKSFLDGLHAADVARLKRIAKPFDHRSAA